MDPLAPAPPSLLGVLERAGSGLYGGRTLTAPTGELPRSGRCRRWRYAAAAGDDLAVGAAIVDLGYVGAAFAWVWADGELTTWDARTLLGRASTVGLHVSVESRWRQRSAQLSLGDHGEMVVDVPTARGRLTAQLGAGPGWPATLVTRTTQGGWNVTEKAAGYQVRGTVVLGGDEKPLNGWGWRDWTVGRQDRHTKWRWAAGAGRCHGRSVGLNVSTGMNAEGVGEDVVWWDGRPFSLEVKDVARQADGLWSLRGPDWSLTFEPRAERAADERLGPFVSRYVQPIGRFEGTLPAPEGEPIEVRFLGVTEDHEARW